MKQNTLKNIRHIQDVMNKVSREEVKDEVVEEEPYTARVAAQNLSGQAEQDAIANVLRNEDIQRPRDPHEAISIASRQGYVRERNQVTGDPEIRFIPTSPGVRGFSNPIERQTVPEQMDRLRDQLRGEGSYRDELHPPTGKYVKNEDYLAEIVPGYKERLEARRAKTPEQLEEEERKEDEELESQLNAILGNLNINFDDDDFDEKQASTLKDIQHFVNTVNKFSQEEPHILVGVKKGTSVDSPNYKPKGDGKRKTHVFGPQHIEPQKSEEKTKLWPKGTTNKQLVEEVDKKLVKKCIDFYNSYMNKGAFKDAVAEAERRENKRFANGEGNWENVEQREEAQKRRLDALARKKEKPKTHQVDLSGKTVDTTFKPRHEREYEKEQKEAWANIARIRREEGKKPIPRTEKKEKEEPLYDVDVGD